MNIAKEYCCGFKEELELRQRGVMFSLYLRLHRFVIVEMVMEEPLQLQKLHHSNKIKSFLLYSLLNDAWGKSILNHSHFYQTGLTHSMALFNPLIFSKFQYPLGSSDCLMTALSAMEKFYVCGVFA